MVNQEKLIKSKPSLKICGTGSNMVILFKEFSNPQLVFKNHIPASFLNDHIEKFIYFKGYTPDHTIQRMVPDGTIYLIFELDGLARYEIDNNTLEKGT